MPNRAHVARVRSKPKRIKKDEHHHYWPYIPVLVMLIITMVVSLFQPVQNRSVLAYATEMSASSLLSATNTQRSNNGKGSLKLNNKLSSAAQAKANDMVARDYWSHTTPDGKEPWYFINAAGYDYLKAGENLAYGFSTSSSTVTGWMNSPSHKANMLDGSFTQVGFGFANSSDFNDSGPETVVVAMYGQPQVLSESTAAAEPTKSTPSTTPIAAAPTTKQPAQKPKSAGKEAKKKPTEKKESEAPVIVAQTQQPVSRAARLSGSNANWLVFAIGFSTGAALVAMLIKHAAGLRHVLKSGERFVLHHPLLDTVLISIVLAGSYLLQTVGYTL